MEDTKSNEMYVEGYKKYDEVYAICIDDKKEDHPVVISEATVVGDVSYRYDYNCLALHFADMEKNDWIELDTDFIAPTKKELLKKLRKQIDELEKLYEEESKNV